MKKKYLTLNWLLFVISLLIFSLFIQWQVVDEFILLNESIAILLVCASIPLNIYTMRVGQYFIFATLLILLFSPLDYSYTTTDANGSSTHQGAKFDSLISPITFVVLIFFTVANFSAMFDLYQLLTKGSEKERKEELSKEIDFYYGKFNGCSNTELVDIFKMYKDYPAGAQLALNRIKKEKGIK